MIFIPSFFVIFTLTFILDFLATKKGFAFFSERFQRHITLDIGFFFFSFFIMLEVHEIDFTR